MLVMELNAQVHTLASSLRKEYDKIGFERKIQLVDLSEILTQELNFNKSVHFNFICTHNSRRSQLAQIWMKASALYFNIDNVFTYSGGTEATAFNSRMVKALSDVGFGLQQNDDSDNPKYTLEMYEQDEFNLFFSKVYDDKVNPESGYVAIMVCDSANEACPVVHGAKEKHTLLYSDPKEFDGTPQESAKYAEKVMEIGREMLFLMENTAAIINI